MRNYTGLLIILCLGCVQLKAQVENEQVDSLRHKSSTIHNDTIPVDSLSLNTIDTAGKGKGYTISENAIEEEITFSSYDSLSFNNAERSIELYNQAVVSSGPIKLKSGFISLDMRNNILHASGIDDSVGISGQYPDMSMDRENFKARELKYNLKAGRGMILDSYREQDDLYIRSEKTKFIEKGDERILYNENGIITTCEYPEPHYGIRSRKQKLILNKIAVIGPSNIEIGGIPTPLWLPFGFFPITSESTTGILFPKDYEYSPALGFGLRDIGYYFPINEYIDLIAKTDIYLRGSYRLSAESRYSKRYKYSGNIKLSYASIKEEIINTDKGTIQMRRSPSMGITMSHRQDPKADPTRTIGGSVNIQTNNFRKDNFNDAQSVLQNSLSSNLSYTELFFDNNVTLTAGLVHSQNTSTNDISISFPNVNVNARRFYPFKQKDKIGKEKWYEGISLKYDMSFKAQLNTKDTLLFTQEALDTIKYGAQHKFSSDHTFNIFRYINVRPSMNFSSTWYPQSIRKHLEEKYRIRYDTIYDVNDEVIAINADTLEYGRIATERRGGFKTQNLFNAQVSLNTTFYGMMRFKKGWLRGVRHVVKPFFNMEYTPDYQKWGYIREYETDLRPEISRKGRYSIFEDGIYSGPAFSPRLGLSYGIDNIFDAKIFSKRDSTEKNITLLPRLSIRSGYNFIADSFKMSPITFNGNFTLFKNFSTVTFSGGFSVYEKDSTGRLYDEYLWENGNGYARFEGIEVQVSSQFSIRQLRDLIMGFFGSKEQDKISNDGVLSIFDNLRLNHNLRLTYDVLIDRDTFFISSHEVNIMGSVPLSENWSIDIGRIGYSFQQKRITYPDLGFSRKLHCWNMGFNWQPERGSYSFFIGVNPGTLDFLKMPYRRNQFDPSQAFF